jgi:HD-GYP domain-containing protein (c-di-GMP phosphodiesterase class II)
MFVRRLSVASKRIRMSNDTSEKNIVSSLYALIQAVQVYDVNNDAVIKTAQKLLDYLNEFFKQVAQIELVRYRDYLFINKQRLRFEILGYASLQTMHLLLKSLNIGSITLIPGVSRDELIGCAFLLKGDEESIWDHVSSEPFPHIHLEPQTSDEETDEGSGGDFLGFQEQKKRIKQTYLKSLGVVKNLMNSLWSNQSIDMRNYRRTVYSLAHSIAQDEQTLLALTSIKQFDEYTYMHSLNVGILAMIMGERIGLGKKNIVNLGTSGILHDIGKTKIPKELITKAGKLTAKEWEIVKRHASYGVIEILKTKGLDEMGLAAMIVAFQHHWNYDSTGYPLQEKTREHTFFARIVRICDAYDAMITARPYQPIPFLPHFAMRVIWAHKNIYFDPALVKVFIQLVGIYPTGSCLELNSGEIGLVIRQNRGHLDLPIVKIVSDKTHEKKDGKTIDLSRQRALEIIKPIYPQKYGINTAEYLM